MIDILVGAALFITLSGASYALGRRDGREEEARKRDVADTIASRMRVRR